MDTDIGQQQEVTEKEPESMQKRSFGIAGLKNILRIKIVIIFPTVICLCLAVIIALYFRGETKQPQTFEKQEQAAHIWPYSNNLEYLEKFAIDIKDEKGLYRVLLCDLVIMLQPGVRIEKDRRGMRGVVYHTIKKRGADIITPQFAIYNLKADLIHELNAYLGEKSIGDIYFTRYMLL